MTHSEIAKALGMTRQTVQYVESIAMEKFKRKFIKLYGIPDLSRTDDTELYQTIMSRLREINTRSIPIEDPFEEEGVT